MSWLESLTWPQAGLVLLTMISMPCVVSILWGRMCHNQDVLPNPDKACLRNQPEAVPDVE